VRTGVLAIMLAALAMIGPFSIDTYLPSFPAIEADLRVSAMHMQQTLSVYLLGFAVMTLFHGTLSDSFGRRPVVLANLLVFALACAGCAFAATFEQLLVFRGIQGLSAGAGIVVGRAIIRDTLQGHAAQRLMSLVTMLFGIAPAVAPVIGGWLQSAFGWRSVFVFLALYAAVLLVACGARLGESLPRGERQPFELRALARNYLTVGRSFPLFLISSAIALNFCGFFVYIVSAPAFVYRILGLSATQFAWVFVPAVAGVTLGAFISGRVAGKLSSRKTVQLAYAIVFGAAAFNLAYCALAGPALPWSVLPVMGYALGMALAMPSLTLLALDLFPHNRGLVSSLLGFQHSLFSAILAGVVSPLLADSALELASGMAALSLAGCACWVLYLALQRRGLPRP
jgi:DHA1 family bicyclomycin/chloramphenicol resistance-like MFS transporter